MGFLDRRFQKKIFTDCKTKFLTVFFGQVFGQCLGIFWQILAIFGYFEANFWQNRAFFLADRFFPWRTFFFVRMINFDCGAELSAVRLEMTTIRHDGRVYDSIRGPLGQTHTRTNIASNPLNWSRDQLNKVNFFRCYIESCFNIQVC